jgi:hypothetical protein
VEHLTQLALIAYPATSPSQKRKKKQAITHSSVILINQSFCDTGTNIGIVGFLPLIKPKITVKVSQGVI